MASITDFEDENGKIDWTAYHEAQIASGDVCYRCKTHMLNLFSTPKGRQLCGGCKGMDSKMDEEVYHERYIRCCHCGHQHNVDDFDCDYGEELYVDGDHEITCWECDTEFEFQTHATYAYTSYPVEKEEE